MENTAKWTKVLGATVLAMAAPLVIATGVSANQLTFSVTPVLPDNQIDKTDGRNQGGCGCTKSGVSANCLGLYE